MESPVYEKIIAKKEFSALPKKDVEVVWKKFEKRHCSDDEKIERYLVFLRRINFLD